MGSGQQPILEPSIWVVAADGSEQQSILAPESLRTISSVAWPNPDELIYIQADSPGKDKESNWLPAPKEPFYMLFRMYLPKIEVLNGQYQLPGVVKAK